MEASLTERSSGQQPKTRMNDEVHPAIGEPSERSKVSHADDYPLDNPEATIGCQREQDHTVTASSTHPSQTTTVDDEHMKIVRRRNQNRIAQMLHRKRKEQQIKDVSRTLYSPS